MFNSLFDSTKKVSEEENDLDLFQPSSEEDKTGFDQELIQELDLVVPAKEYDEYDPDQLEIGIQVETEHTANTRLAAIIAAHHLDELADYYERLKRMEEEAKKEMGEQEGVDKFHKDLKAELGKAEEED